MPVWIVVLVFIVTLTYAVMELTEASLELTEEALTDEG